MVTDSQSLPACRPESGARPEPSHASNRRQGEPPRRAGERGVHALRRARRRQHRRQRHREGRRRRAGHVLPLLRLQGRGRARGRRADRRRDARRHRGRGERVGHAPPSTSCSCLRDVLVRFDEDPAAVALADFIHRPENRALHDRLAENLTPGLVVVVESIVAQGVAEGVFDVPDTRAAAWFVLGGLQSVELSGTPAAQMPAAIEAATELALRALGYRGARRHERRHRHRHAARSRSATATCSPSTAWTSTSAAARSTASSAATAPGRRRPSACCWASSGRARAR